jgi:acetylornithine deacetylase/succinyl-diaminopimelate desuccinylase-like protein
MGAIDTVLGLIDEHFDRSIEKLFELARIPSVSSDPALAGECRRAALWLSDYVSSLGFQSRLMETGGHPVVYAILGDLNDTTKPHVLFYGHYDVQPVDPIEKWTNPPFEPKIDVAKDGTERLLGRGMSDDKGQIFTFLEACRGWIEHTGTLPVNVTIFLEGEEEAGSPSLERTLIEQAGDLAADVVLACDSAMWDRDTPAIATRLKGLFHDKVIVHGPNRDLHSGTYGGVAANPLRVLSNILAGLYDADNRVAIPGFYDEVEQVPASVRQQWRELGSAADAALGDVGLSIPVLETGYTAMEQTWARPVVDINGVGGGNQGPPRSVLPSQAWARLSFRLVASQKPDVIRRLFREHVVSQVPSDCRVSFEGDDGCGAYALKEDNPFLIAAARGLEAEWGRQPKFPGSGGSIPAIGWFKDHLGLDSIMVGFALDDDAIHAPNEKYDVRSMRKGTRSWARILEEVSRVDLKWRRTER